jgi:hypothetical protein
VDATSGAGTVYPSGENEFTQGFNGVHIARSLVSCFLGGGGGGKSPLLYRYEQTMPVSVSTNRGRLKKKN